MPPPNNSAEVEYSQLQRPFLPDYSREEIIALQKNTASELGLPIFFSDTLKVGDSVSNRVGNKGPELAVIPAGQYEMGSPQDEFGHLKEEHPQHYTHIQKPFAMGQYTITANDFEKFQLNTEWSIRPELIWSQGQHPVINVRAYDCELYLEWLSNQTGFHYRLPTEAEWEYATRAGTTSAFHFGDEVTCKEVHFDSLFPYNEAKQKKRWFFPSCIPLSKAIEVGSKPANAWGLHEVHGNVWEITNTPWQSSHLNANRDGTNHSISSNHVSNHEASNNEIVTKGGSWFDAAVWSRSASRKKRLYDEMDTNLGFRVVRELA